MILYEGPGQRHYGGGSSREEIKVISFIHGQLFACSAETFLTYQM